MLSRRATPVSPAVRAVGGVNVGPPPPAPPAIRSPTAVPASQGLGAATASAACRGTGTTAPPAAKVSLRDQSNILLRLSPVMLKATKAERLRKKRRALVCHTHGRRLMSENPRRRAVTFWPADITVQHKSVRTHSCKSH